MNSSTNIITSNWAAGADLLDSMLAETGYAIPQSQLPELADRIQFLESLVSGTQICDLVSDSALFTNPSDISTWINSLIKSGTTNSNPVNQPGELLDDHLVSQHDQLQQELDNIVNKDLELLPDPCSSKAAGMGNSDNNSIQSSSNSSSVPVTMHHLVGGEEEQEAEVSGLKLIHLLLACASCIDDREQLHNTEAMMNEIRILLLAMGERAGAMGRIALYFAQGLEQRLMAAKSPGEDHQMMLEDPGFLEILHLQFYHTCPYLKFGHFTSNQALLEELEGEKAVHIIDLGLGLGLQWPPLIHMLAIGGTPFIRFTAVSDDPQQNLQLQETGAKLGQLAKSVGVELRFHLVSDIKSVQLHPGEAVAVNSMLQLHRLLHDPGLITSALSTIRSFNPRIFTVVEQEADHNGENFQNRFFDALHFYSSMFDAIDAAAGAGVSGADRQQQDDDGVIGSEAFLGREIRNIVASEGKARVERHERLEQWRHRLFSLGFRPRHLGSNAYNQAATLLTIFPGGGHGVYESAGCLTLAWHTRPLYAASAWRCR